MFRAFLEVNMFLMAYVTLFHFMIMKVDKCECSNLRYVSLLSVVGELYGRVLIKRVRAGTECAIAEEQCGFR